MNETEISIDTKPSIARVVSEGKLVETFTEVKEVSFSVEEIEQGIAHATDRVTIVTDTYNRDLAREQATLDMWMERKAALGA